jgi:hypothetical protein
MKADRTVLPNGGLMTVNLYRVTPIFYEYWRVNKDSNTD